MRETFNWQILSEKSNLSGNTQFLLKNARLWVNSNHLTQRAARNKWASRVKVSRTNKTTVETVSTNTQGKMQIHMRRQESVSSWTGPTFTWSVNRAACSKILLHTDTLSDALGPNLSFVPAWKTCEDCSCSVTGRSSVCSVQSTTFHRSFLIINSRDAWKPGGGTKRRRERGDTKWTDYTTLARAPSHSHMHKLYTPPPLPHAFLPSLSVILTNCWSWLSNNNPQSLVLVAQSRKKK